jgi:lysine 2,3-aminomutase
VGTETESVKKKKFIPHPKKWAPRFDYIEKTTSLRDIVISGGDTYLLEPEQVQYIGDRLLAMPHIRRFRFASKGLGVSPSRLLDPNDGWVDTVIGLDRRARQAGKHICIHTHINHPNEITWVTRRGAQRLYEAGVTVRNQSVLLNGVNNTLDTMSELVHALGDINIQPVSTVNRFPPLLSSLFIPPSPAQPKPQNHTIN